MATLEEYALARDTAQNLEGLRRDMRQNALGYKADRLSGRVPLATLTGVMSQDAVQYLRRLDWQDRVDAGPIRVRLLNGLTALGLVASEVRAVVSELRAASAALRDAPKATDMDLDAAADAVLAAVTVHDTVW